MTFSSRDSIQDKETVIAIIPFHNLFTQHELFVPLKMSFEHVITDLTYALQQVNWVTVVERVT